MNTGLIFFLAICIVSGFDEDASGESSPDELQNSHGILFEERSDSESLLRTLLIDNGFYDPKNQRLLSEKGSTLNVSLAMKDEYKASVSIGVDMGMKWFDFRLKWKKSQINLSSFPVNPEDINPPDVVLLNSYDLREMRPFSPSMALLYNNGKVLWYPMGTLKVGCVVDAKYWPLTTLQCDFKFGVPSHPDQEVRLYIHNHHVILDKFSETNKWRISKSEQTEETGNLYDSSDYKQGFFSASLYGKIQPKFRLVFERKPNTFLISVFFVPALLLILFGALFIWITNPLCNYIITLIGLMTFAGLRGILDYLMPGSSNPSRTPIIGIFVTDALYLSMYLMLCNFLVERILMQTGTPPRMILNMLEKKKDGLSSDESGRSDGWKQIACILKNVFSAIYVILAITLIVFVLLPLISRERRDSSYSVFSEKTTKPNQELN